MMEALRDACNYYFYEVGLMTKTADVDYVAMKLGLGEPTGGELTETVGMRANAETKAKVFSGTTQAEWVDGDKLQAVIGQSLNQFTPLQMVCYTSALANEGVRYEATYLRRVVSWDFQKLLLESKPTVASVLEMSDEAKDCIRTGMKMCTKTANGVEGTAQKFLNDYPIPVAAKTGTAQHGTGEDSDNASFVAYAPADDPQVAIAIYVENGAQGGNLGQIVTAILDEYFSQESKYETVVVENKVN
jgi:penicillin-binding protein 2